MGVVTLMISKWSSGPSFLKDKACSQLDSSRSLKTVLYVSLPLLHLFQTCNVFAGIFLPLFMASDDGDDVCLCGCSVIQLCLTLFDPMDSSPQVSSVHGISQQECWCRLTFPTPGDLPTQDRTHISCIGREILYHCNP